MGFYGNITNTARTQFQFDKIYPNKVEMERAQQRDGIYLGRYILIEYDSEHHRDSYERVWFHSKQPTTAYKSDNYELNTIIRNGEAEDNPIVIVYGEGGKEDKFYAWQKPENYNSEQDAYDVAVYDEIVSSNDLQYTINYVIDLNAYKMSRGYDSTVWQKVYNDGVEKYVMIAELNTVVPTFDVSADAPTMSPITPHFDTRSTDVYYKLHWQAPWGFRLAAASSETQSDLKTQWVRHRYNKDNGTTTTEYYYPDLGEWKANKPISNNIDAAIYFNAAGFEEDTPSYVEGMSNEIKITLGQSGNEYNKHDGSIDVEAQDDTQELTINLPGVGNMMSKAWDIIHGPNRDDARTDENGSLQGRLDSFKDMVADEIPVKRGSDGTIIGATINGGKTSSTDLTGKNDDNWIETMVNGDIETITIKHTFNKINDTTTTANKNDSTGDGDNKGSGDTLKLYTPKVDAMGHVVGHNIETVILPYGYKTFSGDEGTGTSADSTQDTMSVIGDNWVQTTISDDEIAIAHIGPVSGTATVATTPTPKFGESFSFKTYDFDDKGHKYSDTTHTVKIPSLTLTDTKANGADVITQLTFTNGTDSTLVSTRSNIGDLTITGYAKPTTGGIIAATDSLNSAIGKLEKNIEIEKSRAEDAETTLTTNLNAEKSRAENAETTLTTNLNAEIEARTNAVTAVNNRIDALIGGDNLNAAFDTLKEVSDWLGANDSDADQIIDDIATLKGDKDTEGSVAKSINDAINELNVSDSAASGQYVSAVSETNGKIAVSRVALPTYTLTPGTVNGTVAFNGVNVGVTGLGTAAYTNSNAYATSAQGILANTAIQPGTLFAYGNDETQKTIANLFETVALLEAEIKSLKEQMEEYHSTETDKPMGDETTE